MLQVWFALVSFVSALCTVSALDIRGRIPWNDHCRDIHELGYARAVLDNGQLYSGGVTHDGSFVIPNVPEGTYVLSIISHDHAFDKLRIDVPPSTSLSDAVPDVRPYIPGTPLTPGSTVLLPYPAAPAPARRNAYFVPPDAFDALGMLKSPMVMMSVAVGVMMLATPYIMKNMDTEALQDLQENHAKISNIQSSITSGDLKSGISALMGSGQQDAPAPGASGVKNRGNKGKRR